VEIRAAQKSTANHTHDLYASPHHLLFDAGRGGLAAGDGEVAVSVDVEVREV
jgi:hypothetical protein